MAKYIVEMQMDKQEKFYFIRENKSGDIVYLPSKYLMHKKRSKISPNTIRRSAFALSYYLNFMDEKQLCLDDVYQMKYIEQHEHFTDFLLWLKAGMHSREDYLKLPNNETCNAYLKEVFRFYIFMEQENKYSGNLKVLSDTQMIVRNSIGIRKILNRKSFRGYLKEKGHQGKTIEQDKIVELLQECANSRDQVLLLLLAETGFRIGELLGVRYAEDIDYEKHIIYVNFRDDNENGARAKNAEFRRAKISDATFDILMFYIEDYKELILGQEYLFINVSGDYVGKPFKGSGVYAMLRRLEKKTGIKASPHMLRHYFARHVFKFYSDAEIKRLNEHIFKMDEQICRALIIHQLLGTRISDTLTLKTDCLSMKKNRYFIRIDQVKSVTYEKAISEEVAQLIIKDALSGIVRNPGNIKIIKKGAGFAK